VQSYRDLANNVIKEIETQQTNDRTKKGFRSSSGSQSPQTYEEIRRLQLEADTWRLLLNLISIDDPSSRASYKLGRQTAFQNLHRYSSDREIWEEFLNADQYGLECVVAMRWLEETSKTTSQEFDALITEMEAQSERGQGLWTTGWLYTKEAIKGHKRLRAWPQPIEPNDPGISRSLVSNDEQKPLVTQLDPDAITRQKHNLEKQDQFFERATWITCWKMLRQGESWTKIREWADSRLEGWRAVSLCGSSVDPKSASSRYPSDDGHTRLMNSRAHDSWRSACSALTRNSNTDEFQRAVYALLSGETDAAASVCRSWDDFLYVYFNRVVLTRYQGFCKQFQRKLSHSPNTPVAFVPEPAGHAELQKFLIYLKGNDRVSGEARNPFRNIQAAILSKGYDSFFPSLAQAVSQIGADKYGKDSVIPEVVRTPVDESFLIAADDEEAVRIAAHVYVVASARGYARVDTHFVETASVIVAGHISNLEERGLFDLVPLYVSLLPTAMGHDVLAKILIEIIDPQEKMQQVRLARKHNIDMEAVLDVQWSLVKQNVPLIDHSRGVTGYSRVLRRPDGSRSLVSPKTDLIGTSVAPEDEKLIRSLEWLRFIDGQWDKICDLGSWLYRKFFRRFSPCY
jgi:nuclear pore complex protein Nup107